MDAFIKSVFYLCALAVSIVFSGFTISVLWAWFAVPLGAPVIGIAHALGLRLMAAVSTYTYAEDKRTNSMRLINAFVLNAFALGFGWVYQSLIH